MEGELWMAVRSGSKSQVLLAALLVLLSCKILLAEESSLGESPLFTDLVARGELPPVVDRLPLNPAVVIPLERTGQYGGTWRRAHMGMVDEAGWERLTCDPLLRWSPDYTKPVPNIAESWEVTEDGKQFTFYLREGMKWSDGEPFTAHDYMFWYNDVILNEDLTPVKPNWMTIEGELGVMAALDDHTLRFTFNHPNGVILQWLASWTELFAGPPPAHYLRQYHPKYVQEDSLDAVVELEGYDTWMALYEMKSNPFLNPDKPVICAWQARTGADAAVFIAERNPYYWKVDTQGNQLPYIDRIEQTLVQSAETVTLKAIAGEIDMQGRRVNFEDYPLLMEHRTTGNYRILRWQSAATGQGTIYLNQNYRHVDPVMADLLENQKFRQALSLGVNRKQIIDLFFMGVVKGRQVVPMENSLYGVPGTDTLFTTHDPVRANHILDGIGLGQRDSAGFRLRPDGQRLKFTIAGFTPGTQYVDVAELVSMHWRDLGIHATVKPEDRILWVVRATAGEHAVSVYAASGGFKPLLDPVWFFPSARTAYWAPLHGLWYGTNGKAGDKPTGKIGRIVEIYDEARRTVDEKKQTELVKEAVKLHAENLWRIGVCGGFDGLMLVKNNFRNVPDVSVSDNPPMTPGNTHPEQYYFRR